MEPNKLENQIREKLNGRELQPSANSWDRLDAMLSVKEERKSRKAFPWISIAASFFILAGFGYYFLTQNKGNQIQFNNTPAVVETIHNVNEERPEQLVVEKETATFLEENKQTSKKQQRQQMVETISEENKNKVHNSSNRQIANVQNSEKRENKNEQINTNIINKEEVDTESLLALVEKPKTESKSKVKVDAKELLSQVDGEIQLTFRQKVMRTIKKNYQETKVAISTRNQESSFNH